MKTIEFNKIVYATFFEHMDAYVTDEDFHRECMKAKEYFMENTGLSERSLMTTFFTHFWSGMYLTFCIFDIDHLEDENGEVILLE